ncbi:putative permease [Evansella vedderi]|uniref:Permease n=1 Tax=Evansella vedderi TaxID=38282 RepID=A0ABT9ZYD2_9BACI|nr:AEC family transporter [Evansella vedderi]MDQ0255130.1 putative permease [Evansella vedderi]
MSILLFFQEIVVLYIIAVIGWIASIRGVLNQQSDKIMIQLVLYVTLPSLIIYSMNFTMDWSVLYDFLWLIGLSIFAMLTAITLSLLLNKKFTLPSSQEGIFQSLIIFGNQGFIGYAVCYMLFGEKGIMYGAIYNITFLLFIWTYGVFIVARHKEKLSLKQVLTSPGLVATIFGVAILLLPMKIPTAISRPLEYIGTMTIPLSMLIIGSIIAKLNLRQLNLLLKNKYLWIASISKLVIIPLFLFPFMIFSISYITLAVAILIAGMPSGPTTSLFAVKYNADTEFAALGVSLSTVLSLFTIPLIYTLLSFFIW